MYVYIYIIEYLFDIFFLFIDIWCNVNEQIVWLCLILKSGFAACARAQAQEAKQKIVGPQGYGKQRTCKPHYGPEWFYNFHQFPYIWVLPGRISYTIQGYTCPLMAPDPGGSAMKRICPGCCKAYPSVFSQVTTRKAVRIYPLVMGNSPWNGHWTLFKWEHHHHHA